MKLEKLNLALKLPTGWLLSSNKQTKKFIVISTLTYVSTLERKRSVSCGFILQNFVKIHVNIGVSLISTCPSVLYWIIIHFYIRKMLQMCSKMWRGI